MSNEAFVGWDIGGAHLKLACVTAAGEVTIALQLPMPLWQGIHILGQSMTEAKQYLPQVTSLHSITTTAELVDIFKDRRTGIKTLARYICNTLNQKETRFYAGRSGWVNPGSADQHSGDIASANWHATAAYVASSVCDGILIDIGSTTTDIIMFTDGQVRYHGYTDFERLWSHELVYTGIVRTPVLAVTDKAPIAGKLQPVTAELFAHMADVYRLTGELQGQDDMQNTSDGCGKSLVDSARRLARMFGSDLDEHGSLELWQNVAAYLAGEQLTRINQALHIVRSRQERRTNEVLVGAGTGRFLAQKLACMQGLKYLDFSDLIETTAQMKSSASVSATAVSVAQLARLQQ
jgi:(4-(4-[2-(gamma-L-glutamylamino)ethyl]phenoxymethyl)furan-2-yl)methanamine synthase